MTNGSYIEGNGGTVETWQHAGGVRVQLPDRHFVFLGLNSEELQQQVEEMMNVALPYYGANVAKTSTAVDDRHVEEASLLSALLFISLRHEWKRRPWFLRWRKPVLDVAEFEHNYVRDEILRFCQKTFGEYYVHPAAALMGMRPEEFAAWEARRRKFWEMW